MYRKEDVKEVFVQNPDISFERAAEELTRRTGLVNRGGKPFSIYCFVRNLVDEGYMTISERTRGGNRIKQPVTFERIGPQLRWKEMFSVVASPFYARSLSKRGLCEKGSKDLHEVIRHSLADGRLKEEFVFWLEYDQAKQSFPKFFEEGGALVGECKKGMYLLTEAAFKILESHFEKPASVKSGKGSVGKLGKVTLEDIRSVVKEVVSEELREYHTIKFNESGGVLSACERLERLSGTARVVAFDGKTGNVVYGQKWLDTESTQQPTQ